MIQIENKLHGFEELTRLLRKLPDETKLKALRPETKAMGELLKGIAIQLSPYRTGALRRSIRRLERKTAQAWESVHGLRVVTRRKLTKRLGFVEGNAKGKAGATEDPYYWFFQEFGTVHMKARPFLRPALEGNREEYVESFRRGFGRRLERLVKQLHAQYRRAERAGVGLS